MSSAPASAPLLSLDFPFTRLEMRDGDPKDSPLIQISVDVGYGMNIFSFRFHHFHVDDVTHRMNDAMPSHMKK